MILIPDSFTSSRAEALYTVPHTPHRTHAPVEGRRVVADLRLLRERERKEREKNTAGNSTEREKRDPYCDRGERVRENQRKEGDWFFGTPVLFKSLTRYNVQFSGARLRNTVTFPSLRAQSARVLHLNRSVLRSGKREKGQITAVCALRGFRTRGLETRSLSLSPPPKCMSNTNTRVAERMLPRLWFIQVSVRSGCHGPLARRGGMARGKACCATHTVHTYIRTRP